MWLKGLRTWVRDTNRLAKKAKPKGRVCRPGVEHLEDRLAPATLTVNTGLDAVHPIDGGLSLRDAIAAVSAGDMSSLPLSEQNQIDVGTNGFGIHDTINFNIGGGGIQTIQLTSALDPIIKSVVIDGYSQPGASPNTLAIGSDAVLEIVLSGSLVGSGLTGLNIQASNCTIKGLVINGFTAGIGITISGPFSSNQIAGNYIGTDVSGTQGTGTVHALPDYTPAAYPDAPGLMHDGILLSDGASHNYIGSMDGSAVDPADRNVISANSAGIVIRGSSNPGQPVTGNNTIAGNYIGTDKTGETPLGNWGGIATLAGWWKAPSLNPNSYPSPASPPTHDVIENNLISGNKFNINFGAGVDTNSAYQTQIFGNVIGLDAQLLHGFANMPAGSLQAGIGGIIGAHDVQIGDGTPEHANIIAGNSGAGIALQNYRDNPYNISVRGNSIYNNGGLGIDLSRSVYPQPFEGNTNPSRPEDSAKPNHLQIFPVLSSVTVGSSTTVLGSLSSSLGTGPFVIDFYASPASDNPSFREGKVYLGSESGVASGIAFSASLPAIPAGDVITATATDSLGNTSQFSAAAFASLVAPASLAEGASLSLDGTGSTDPLGRPLTYSWSIDGSTLADTTSAVILSWAQLQALGVTVGNPIAVGLQLSNGIDAPVSAALNVPVDVLSSANLQSTLDGPLPTDGTTGHPTLTAMVDTQADADSLLSILASTNPAPLTRTGTTTPPIDIVVTLGTGISLDEASLAIPAGFRAQINGGSWHGGSPALTLTAGDLTITGATFDNATNAPTILVTGGNLTLGNDTIKASTDQADNPPVIQVTGGTIDLSTLGGNSLDMAQGGTLNVSGVILLPGASHGSVTDTSYSPPSPSFHGFDSLLVQTSQGTATLTVHVGPYAPPALINPGDQISDEGDILIPPPPPPTPGTSLDVDGNGQVDASTDGLLILSYLFSFAGPDLINNSVGQSFGFTNTNLIGPGATRTSPAAVRNYLDSVRTSMLDVDANGVSDALTDGVLILRYMEGVTGTALTTHAIGQGALRTDPSVIVGYLDASNPNLGYPLPPPPPPTNAITIAGSNADPGSFTATGLPPGLTISRDGVFSGTINPRGEGTYHVVVSARDGVVVGSTSFTWTVNDTTPPALTSPGDQASNPGDTLTTTSPVSGPSLDVDGNNRVDASTDGILIVSYLFHFTGAVLTNNTVGQFFGFTNTNLLGENATRIQPFAIINFLDGARASMLDVDGNGLADPLTDGFLIVRYMEGITGPALTAGAIGGSATRTDPAAIVAFLDTYNHVSPGQLQAIAIAAVDADPGSFSATGLPPGLTISGDGVISGTIDLHSSGTYHVVVSALDGSVVGSTSFTWTISKAKTTTNLVSTGPAAFGTAVTLTATVSPQNTSADTPTGTVTFMDGTTVLGSGTLDASGIATFTTTALGAGDHPGITAIYGGDSNFATSTSAAFDQLVLPGDTVAVLTSDSPAFSDPSTFEVLAGQTVTFTDTVSAVGMGAAPEGTVTIRVDGVAQDQPVSLGPDGTASFTTFMLSAGLHTITALYNGDGSYGQGAQASLSGTANSLDDPNLSADLANVIAAHTANTVTLTASSQADLTGIIAAVNGLSSSESGTVNLNVAAGVYEGVTLDAPQRILFNWNGSSVPNGTVIDPASPALTMKGGTATFNHITFTTTGDSPTIVVMGGSLTLVNDIVQQSSDTNNPAVIDVQSGGDVDLGAGNTLTAAQGNTIHTSGFTLTPGQVNVLTVSDAGGTYNATPYAAVASATGDGTITLSYYNAVGFLLAGAPTNAGTYSVVVSFVPNAGSGFEAASSAPLSFTIAQAPLTIAAVGDSRTYNGTTTDAAVPTVIGTLYGNDTVTDLTQAFASKDARGSGQSTLQVSSYSVNDGAGGNNYSVSLRTASGTITPARLTITAVSNSKTYDGTTSAEAMPIITSGTVFGGDTAQFMESYTTSKVGTGLKLKANGAVDDGNGGADYTCVFIGDGTGTITPATPTVAVTDAGGTFQNKAFPAKATVTGISGDPAASLERVIPALSYFSLANGIRTPLSVAPSEVGRYEVDAFFAGSADYTAAGPAVTTFTITQAVPSLTVKDAGGTFNGNPFPATFTLKNVNGSAVTNLEGVSPMLTYYRGTYALINLPGAGGTTTAPTSAGDYTVVATFAGSNDYTATAALANFTIKQVKTTVTVADAGGTYNGNSFLATLTLTANGNQVSSLEGVFPTLTYYSGTYTLANLPGSGGSATAPTSAGSYTVLASFAGSTDYAGATALAHFTIKTAKTTLTVTAAGGAHNGSPFSATATLTDVNGNLVGNLDGVLPTLTYYAGKKASGTPLSRPPSDPGIYTVVASFAGSTNYASTANVQVTFTIT